MIRRPTRPHHCCLIYLKLESEILFVEHISESESESDHSISYIIYLHNRSTILTWYVWIAQDCLQIHQPISPSISFGVLSLQRVVFGEGLWSLIDGFHFVWHCLWILTHQWIAKPHLQDSSWIWVLAVLMSHTLAPWDDALILWKTWYRTIALANKFCKGHFHPKITTLLSRPVLEERRPWGRQTGVEQIALTICVPNIYWQRSVILTNVQGFNKRIKITTWFIPQITLLCKMKMKMCHIPLVSLHIMIIFFQKKGLWKNWITNKLHVTLHEQSKIIIRTCCLYLYLSCDWTLNIWNHHHKSV